MNNDDKLNELFNKAKNEQSLISKDEARNLLVNKPATFFYKKNPGVKIMYAVSSVIIASLMAFITGIIPLNNQNSVSDNKVYTFSDFQKSNVNYQSGASNVNAEKFSHDYEAKANSDDWAYNDKSTDENNNEGSVATAYNNAKQQNEVKGIRSIDLNDDELEAIGIVREGSTIRVYTDSIKNLPYIMFNKNGCIFTKLIDKNNNNIDGINFTGHKFTPKAITDQKGCSYFVLAADHGFTFSTYFDKDSNKITTTAINPLNNKKKIKTLSNVSVSTSTTTIVNDNKAINIDSLLKALGAENGGQIASATQVSINNGELEKINQDSSKQAVFVSISDSTNAIAERVINMIKNKISKTVVQMKNTKVDGNYLPDNMLNDFQIQTMLSSDSLTQDISDSVKKIIIENIANNGKNTLDSASAINIAVAVNQGSDDNISQGMLANDDISLDTLKKMIEKEWIKKDTDKTHMAFAKKISGKIDNFVNKISDYVNINKLIPVNVYVDNKKYIFWYEPTDEFVNALPDSISEKIKPEIQALKERNNVCEAKAIAGEDTYFDVWRACAGAVENLQVYPNPAKDYVNLSFSLTKDRYVNVSINDLNGNRVKAIAKHIPFKYGINNYKVDLSGLTRGMYLMVLETEEGEQAVQRLIIE